MFKVVGSFVMFDGESVIMVGCYLMGDVMNGIN